MNAISASLTAISIGSLVVPSNTMPLMTVRMMTPRRMEMSNDNRELNNSELDASELDLLTGGSIGTAVAAGIIRAEMAAGKLIAQNDAGYGYTCLKN